MRMLQYRHSRPRMPAHIDTHPYAHVWVLMYAPRDLQIASNQQIAPFSNVAYVATRATASSRCCCCWSTAGVHAQAVSIDCLLLLLFAAVAIAIDLATVVVVVAVLVVACNNTFTVMSTL